MRRFEIASIAPTESCCTPTDAEEGCGCGSTAQRSVVACPACGCHGTTVNTTTPSSTLRAIHRSSVREEGVYTFCESPNCPVVYYHSDQQQNPGNTGMLFTVEQLINRVTVKDDSQKTPLCYCFKVLKGEALDEIARTGSVDIIALMNRRRRPGQECFCEISNPRGDCCTEDIRNWLTAQGLDVDRNEDLCGC
ncbi:MAG: hypothetical protein HQL50_04225 [Magnetococcales bacterium]|nr:hypothetical protein [Magnetococcales bacterium]